MSISGQIPMNERLTINGVDRRITPLSNVIYADSPEHPGVRCSCHRFTGSAHIILENGGAIFTNGNRYENYRKGD